MRYKRSQAKGATFFFTVVTHNRRPILGQECNVALLRKALADVMSRHPFTIDAVVVLPEHLHCIWTLPQDDNDFSNRWRQVKSYFSRKCPEEFKGLLTNSQKNRGVQAVWQQRFWEHQIRDESDLIRHVEYIHYNPVKHGLVNSPAAWPYSSFHRYVDQGIYHSDWGSDQRIEFDRDVGNE